MRVPVIESLLYYRNCKNILPRGPLLTICKSFMRPHLDYGDVIYDQHYNNTFHEKLESMQYNDAVPIESRIRFGIFAANVVV